MNDFYALPFASSMSLLVSTTEISGTYACFITARCNSYCSIGPFDWENSLSAFILKSCRKKEEMGLALYGVTGRLYNSIMVRL